MKSLTINATILTILLALLSGIPLHAQSSKLLFGANAGVNLSKFKFSGSDNVVFPNKTTKFGYNGGISAGIEIKRMALLTGLEFISKASKYETDNIFFEEANDVGYFSFEERINYLSIPILLRLRLLNEDFGITLTMGPKISMGLNSKVVGQFSTFSGYIEEEEYEKSFGSNINEEYKKVHSSFVLSPGVFFAVGESGRLGANLLLDFGTSNMYNDRYLKAIGDNSKVRINSTMLTFTYEHYLSIGDKY